MRNIYIYYRERQVIAFYCQAPVLIVIIRWYVLLNIGKLALDIKDDITVVVAGSRLESFVAR